MIRNHKTVIVLSWAVVCLLTSAHAAVDKPEEIAKTHFSKKEYEQALAIWYGMVDAGHSTPGVYFNIGVAESMHHNVSKSLMAYEQALRLNPLNPKIKSAIVEERKKIENATIPVEPFFLSEWYTGLVTLFRPGVWSMFGLCSLLISLMDFLSEQRARSGRRYLKPIVRHLLIVTGVLFLLIACLSFKEVYRENEAILMEKSEIRRAATEDSPVVRVLYAGEKLRITDEIGEWYHVELLNLDVGWIKKQPLQRVLISKG